MKNRLLTACLFFLSINTPVLGQITFEEPPEKVASREAPISSFYVELFGNAYSLSLNYDLIGKNNFGVRIGITPVFLPDKSNSNIPRLYDDTYSQSFQLLLMPNYFIGKGTHRLELGAGFVFGFSDNDVNLGLPAYPAFSGTIGYRLLPIA